MDDCRYEKEGYCGYSQETMTALVKDRDKLKRENERLARMLNIYGENTCPSCGKKQALKGGG